VPASRTVLRRAVVGAVTLGPAGAPASKAQQIKVAERAPGAGMDGVARLLAEAG
jgi:hypothetical protein